MGFLSGIFDGGDDGPSTTSVSKFMPEQDELLRKVIEQLTPHVGGLATPYPGETFAGMPPEFQEAIDRYFGSRGEFSDQISGVLTKQLGGEPAYVHDYQKVADLWQEGFVDPAMQEFNKNIASDIRERYASNLYSTRAEGAVTEGAVDLMSSLTPVLASAQMAGMQMEAQSRENAATRQTGAMQMASNLGLMEFQQDLAVAQTIQQQNQAELLDAYQRFMRMTPESSPWYQLAMRAAGVGGQGRIDTIAQPQGGGFGDFLGLGLSSFMGSDAGSEGIMSLIGNIGGMFGGGGSAPTGGTPGGSGGGWEQIAMQAGMTALMAASDVRLKENIEMIPNALDRVANLKGYTYNYTFDDEGNRSGGVMAQTLEEVLPDAVREINGIKFVRYDAVIGLLVNAINELHDKIKGA